MKKILLTRIVLATSVLSLSSVFAHELFVSTGSELATGANFDGTITIDHYPAVSPLSVDTIKVIKPLQLLGSNGEIKLTQQSAEKYISDAALEKGSYLGVVSTNEYYYTKTPEGVVQDSKDKVEDALSCTKYALFTKAVINVDGAVDTDLITKPQNFSLEIVPVGNPSTTKVGEPVTAIILRDGKPLANQKVGAEFSIKGGAPDLEAVTNDKGEFTVTPSKAGDWIILTYIKEGYKEPKVCDELVYETSLTFNVKP